MQVAGIGFAFAPRFHAATRHVGGPRKRARHAHDLQPARAADEPGERRAPGRRRLRPRVVRARRGRARRARPAPRGGRPRRGRPRRDRGARRDVRRDVGRRRRAARSTLTPRAFGFDERRSRRASPAAMRRTTRACCARCSPATRSVTASATRRCCTPRAMTAALGLELLEPALRPRPAAGRSIERARRRAMRSGAARLVLHKWREVSQAAPTSTVDDLAALTPPSSRGSSDASSTRSSR